jgi:hypothetical protein
MKFDEKIKPSIVLLICVVVIGIVFLPGYYKCKNYDRAIKTNSSLTIGKVYGFSDPRKQAQTLKFKFEFDGKTFYATSSCSDPGWRVFEGAYRRLYPEIKGKFFPVFFSKDNPTKYSKILVTAADFKEYGFNYPDSLKWIETILQNY